MPPLRLGQRWILVAFAGLCAAVVAGWLAPFGWPFELFAHFRPQLAVAALAFVPVLLALRAPRAALAGGVLCALLFAPRIQHLRAAEPSPVCRGEAFTVVTANVEFTNRQPEPLARWLAAQSADVIVLQEVTPHWAAAIATWPEYPYRRILPRDDPYGIAILSRWPFETVQAVDLAGDGLPSLQAVMQVRGERIQVLGLHTRWPVMPDLARLRDTALLRMAALARASATPTVAAGDFNLTPDSPVFAQTLEDSGLRDVFEGRGWHPTWMAGFWPLALRIDHQLASPSLCVERAAVGPEIGSDHRPVSARYRLPRGAAT